MIVLESSRLRVELAEPGEAPNITSRFDRAGFITEVVLDQGIRYCASEPKNLCHPCSGGRGVCSEWVFDVSEQCGQGEWFPKFGVGLFQKKYEGRYRIFHQYADAQVFPVTVSRWDNGCRMETEGIPCMGYRLKEQKEITVMDNRLTMTVTVRNTGEKPTLLEEYCHNFFSIDGMALGSDYVLSMPSIADQGRGRLKNVSGENGSIRGWGRGFTFCEQAAVASDRNLFAEEIDQNVPFYWKLTHYGAGAYVSEQDDFVPSRVALWAVDHIVCPEIFAKVFLHPGEEATWTRQWTFGTVEES